MLIAQTPDGSRVLIATDPRLRADAVQVVSVPSGTGHLAAP
jgi:hypothetical protein